jgi:hypothetical protein
MGPKGKGAGILVDAGTPIDSVTGPAAARYQPGCSANCQRQPWSSSKAFT